MRSHDPEGVTAGLVRGVLSQRADVKQLEEAKKTLEGQLGEIRLQLEKDGYASVAQMRYVRSSGKFVFEEDFIDCCVGVFVAFSASSFHADVSFFTFFLLMSVSH